MADDVQSNLTTLTVDLLAAYLETNKVRPEDLTGLIQTTYTALAGLSTGVEEAHAEPEHIAAVGARKSLSDPAHIISMIDGKPYKSLKRHLTSHGLSPDEYRSRYKLPATYPMVAPAYSEARREVAKKLGLGRKPKAAATPEPALAPEPVAAKPARKPRAKKAPSE